MIVFVILSRKMKDMDNDIAAKKRKLNWRFFEVAVVALFKD
jgi:hypothetical protein